MLVSTERRPSAPELLPAQGDPPEGARPTLASWASASTSGHTADIWHGPAVQKAILYAEGNFLNESHLYLYLHFINIKAIYEGLSETYPLPKSREKRNDLSEHVFIFGSENVGPMPRHTAWHVPTKPAWDSFSGLSLHLLGTGCEEVTWGQGWTYL